jgi:hypothetical protein
MIQCARQQLAMIALMNPTTRPAWVRQRDRNDALTRALDAVLASDQFLERQAWKKVLDCESPDWNEQPRADEPQFVLEPARAIRALRR